MKIEIEKFLDRENYINSLFFNRRLVQINTILDKHNSLFKLYEDIKSFFDATNEKNPEEFYEKSELEALK
jgi:hypothetical protein